MLELLTFALSPHVPLWAGTVALLALTITAVVDARTGLVPPLPLAFASLALIAGLILQDSPRALSAPLYALLFYAAIFLINEVHFKLTGRDALGLGDAHWSLVAVLAYGVPLTLMAWGVGAWLALLWLGARRVLGKPAGHVYFVPFLLVALLLLQGVPFIIS